MKHGGLFVLLLAIVALGPTASGFDGKRQGFVMGAGLGANVYSRISPEASIWDAQTGLALHGLLGYAQNDHNLLALEGNIASHNLVVGHGFFGPSWYRYFGSPGNAIYTVVGLGVYYYNEDAWFSEPVHHETGLGYMVGGGVEFVRHLQLGVYFSGGTTHFNDVDYSLNHLNVLLSYVAF